MSLSPTPSELAERHLGPVCGRVLGEASPARAYEKARAEGADEEEALLHAVFPAAQERRDVAGELLQYFASLLFSSREAYLGQDLRRLFDTEDLVQSVIGDLYPMLTEFEFQSRAQFLELLVTRLGWKKMDKARRQNAVMRGGGWKRTSTDPEQTPEGMEQSRPMTPLSAMVNEEEEVQLVIALNRLEAEDQRVLRAVMGGATSDEIGAELGCSPEAARKRAERARGHLRTEMKKLQR